MLALALGPSGPNFQRIHRLFVSRQGNKCRQICPLAKDTHNSAEMSGQGNPAKQRCCRHLYYDPFGCECPQVYMQHLKTMIATPRMELSSVCPVVWRCCMKGTVFGGETSWDTKVLLLISGSLWSLGTARKGTQHLAEL